MYYRQHMTIGYGTLSMTVASIAIVSTWSINDDIIGNDDSNLNLSLGANLLLSSLVLK